MTAVDVDDLDKLAAVLDDTATGLWMGQHGPGWGRVVANALLPVVDRIANERAAAELRAAADVASFTPLSQRESGTLTDFTEGWHAAAQFLRSRADELDGDR